MAKDERLNEEAARDPRIPLSARPEDLTYLNQLADEKKQLPKQRKESDPNEEGS
ncbi:MAG TPA: hypothetical protein VFT51_11360 [Bacillales bacterium]|nr:hypothetical protein [Bacillales bacterium]